MHVLFAKTLLNTPNVPPYLLRLNGIKKKKKYFSRRIRNGQDLGNKEGGPCFIVIKTEKIIPNGIN